MKHVAGVALYAFAFVAVRAVIPEVGLWRVFGVCAIGIVAASLRDLIEKLNL